MKAIFYDWGGLNVWLFHVINNVRGSLIDAVMQFGTDLGDHANFPLYIAAAVVAGLTLSARAAAHERVAGDAMLRSWMLALAVFACANAADGLLVGWLKDWLDFPRPPRALPPESLHVIGTPEYNHGLPSGHAVFAMTVAASLWPVLIRPGRIGMVVYVLWVGVSRVSLGAHFPADVIAGYALALIVVFSLRSILRRYSHSAY